MGEESLPTSDDVRFEFLKLDYEKGLQLLGDLQNHKIEYQKFFIAVVGVVGTVSVALFNFVSASKRYSVTRSGLTVSVQEMIGLLLVVASFVAYFIVKNLSSIRVNEVFFNNAIQHVRQHCIQRFSLGENYPNIERIEPLRRTSADYVTILVCAVINLIMLLCGFALLFPNLDGLGGVILLALTALVYLGVYLATIEREMARPVVR